MSHYTIDVVGLIFRCLVALVVLALTVNLSLSRHYDCNEAALQDVKPPFDGELLPQTAVFVERRGWFQWSRLIDVYEGGTETAGEADSKRIGYFYDMNLLFFKRFGFSDAQDRIWFEGRYPSLLSRVKPYHEYELRRCDARGGTFDAVEQLWDRSFLCFFSCEQSFTLSKRSRSGVRRPAANVKFDSKLKVNAALNARHAWFMSVEEHTDGTQMATAQQHFAMGNSNLRGVKAARCFFCQLSHWTLSISSTGRTEESVPLPNWVVGFMAALDDLLHSSK